jgi:hypothetical protein
MATWAVSTLKILQCFSSKSGHSRPYIWSALVFVDNQTLADPDPKKHVGIVGPPPDTVQVVLKQDMRPGDTADIPTSVGVLGTQIDEGFLGAALVVLLFQKEETPVDAMLSGFQEFLNKLPSDITDNDNLQKLIDPSTRGQAIDDIAATLQTQVTDAINNHLGISGQAKVIVLGKPQDSPIGHGHQFFDNLRSQFVSVLISTGGAGLLDEYRVSGLLDTGSWAAKPVVSWGPNRLDIFGLGVDNDMFHKWWDPAWTAPDGTHWGPSQTGWEWRAGTFNSPPAVVSWGPNRLDVFGLGIYNDMYHQWWDGANWGPSPTDPTRWESLGGIFSSPPAAVSWGFGRLDLFGLGVANIMFHKWWDPAWQSSDGTNWGPS